MAKKKDITYKFYQSLIKDKDRSVNAYIEDYLTKTQSMFAYNGLPETIPVDELENILQVNGCCFVTDVDGSLYALSGSQGGELDAYYRPTEFIVANPYLKLTRSYKIGEDGVLFKNDFYCNGLLPIIGKYAVLLTDSGISLNTATILSRITMLISASDDKTKASADLFLQKIKDGDFSIIGENAFFKGVQLQTAPTTNTSYITQLIELVQYYKANLLNDLGLNANFNMKRERLNTSELAMNVDCLLPFADNMLNERRKAVEAINSKYGTDITVDFSSSWKTLHEDEDRLNTFVDVDGLPTHTDTETTQADTETTQTDTADTQQTQEEDGIKDTDETIETSSPDNSEQEQKQEKDSEDEN